MFFAFQVSIVQSLSTDELRTSIDDLYSTLQATSTEIEGNSNQINKLISSSREKARTLDLEIGSAIREKDKLLIEVSRIEAEIKALNKQIEKSDKKIKSLKDERPTNWGFLGTLFTPSKKAKQENTDRQLKKLNDQKLEKLKKVIDAYHKIPGVSYKVVKSKEKLSNLEEKLTQLRFTLSQLNDVDFKLKKLIAELGRVRRPSVNIRVSRLQRKLEEMQGIKTTAKNALSKARAFL